jgi:dimethylamine monooxygenase subunit A
MSHGYIYPPPTDGKPFRLIMGLRALEPAAWLEAGDDLVSQIPERLALASDARDVVYQELPGYRTAVDDLVQLVIANLKTFHSERYLFEGHAITHRETGTQVNLESDDVLLGLASIIGEDLVVLSRENDEWKIVAGAVIFPSRWKLTEKIGKGMDAVHTPVPGYATSLAPFMTATFDKVSPDRAVWRKNWSLHSTEDLYQPTSIHIEANPENYWWRTERQTLTRSAIGDYLYFTIRNRAEPLQWIKEDQNSASAFAETLASYSPETIEYKGLQRDHQKLVDYLRNAEIR